MAMAPIGPAGNNPVPNAPPPRNAQLQQSEQPVRGTNSRPDNSGSAEMRSPAQRVNTANQTASLRNETGKGEIIDTMG